MKSSKIKVKKASFLPEILMIATITMILATAILTFVAASLKRSNLYNRQISADNISEAGINYYLWHLTHNETDFQDKGLNGVSQCSQDHLVSDGYYGPCHHPYKDASGAEVGSYDLYIYPPDITTASIQIKSVGRLIDSHGQQKTIVARLGIPYFSKYFLLNYSDELWIGNTETVNGPVHNNNPNAGIRNDGSVGQASSTCVSTYVSKMFGNEVHNCIWGSGVFNGGQIYPTTSFDLADINFTSYKNSAIASNSYYPELSSGYGYHVVLKANSYDINKVTSATLNTGYSPVSHKYENYYDQYTTEQSFLTDQPYPTSGLVFIEDNFWIDGTIQDKKVTFVAGKPTETDPTKYKGVYISNNLLYHEKNTDTKLGIISQNFIQISRNASADLTLDAALLTKEGYIFIPDFSELKNKLSIYGSMAHQGGLLFSYANSDNVVVSGFQNTLYNHDPDLVFDPPPFFPKSGSYQIINWQEDPDF
jgi:hypothetical protein